MTDGGADVYSRGGHAPLLCSYISPRIHYWENGRCSSVCFLVTKHPQYDTFCPYRSRNSRSYFCDVTGAFVARLRMCRANHKAVARIIRKAEMEPIEVFMSSTLSPIT